MFFAKNALGLEICQEGIRISLLDGKRDAPQLKAFAVSAFPVDTLRVSLRELNILNQSAFVAGVREAYLKMLTKTDQISLSLPDSAGRVILMDLETRFKSRQEGADIIRWKLKKSFPLDVAEIHLDYQVLQEKETGEISTLVSLISRQVITQYEDLLLEAGLQPNHIDFTTFNLYHFFSNRLEMNENSAIISFYGGVLSVLIFYGGVLTFYRAKDIPGSSMDANRIFREISSSILVYQDMKPGRGIDKVFCIISPEDMEVFGSVVAESTQLEPVRLDAERVVTSKAGGTIDRTTFHMLTASLGAAVRNL